MEELTTDELIKEVSHIIGGGRTTPEDIKKLTQLRWYLSIQYRNTNMFGSSQEGLYNSTRANQTKLLAETMAVSRAEAEAKSMAEEQYGSYRSENADAQWISKLLDSITGYIINTNVENKVWTEAQF